MHLTLRQLYYFVEVVDAGNMTKAADHLHIAPTALSQQVRAMEERLSVRLLQRHSRGVRPTAAGTELYRRGQLILAMVDETEREFLPDEAGRISLRLGMPQSLARIVGVETVLGAGSRVGGLTLQLTEGNSRDLAERLRNGEFDFILARELPPSAAIRSLDIVEERLVFVTAPSAARAGGAVTLAEALHSDLVFYGEKGVCWRVVHAAAQAAGLTVNVTHIVESPNVIRGMVMRGLGATIISFGAIEEESRHGEVVVHEIEDAPLLRTSLAALPAMFEANSAGGFVDFVVDTVVASLIRIGPYYRPLAQSAALSCTLHDTGLAEGRMS